MLDKKLQLNDTGDNVKILQEKLKILGIGISKTIWIKNNRCSR